MLNWALVGLAKLRKLKQFPECPAGAALKEEHRTACDHEREFLTESVVEEPGSSVSSSELYNEYKRWMRRNGYHHLGARNFKIAVKRVFPKSYEDRQRIGINRMMTLHNIKMINIL